MQGYCAKRRLVEWGLTAVTGPAFVGVACSKELPAWTVALAAWSVCSNKNECQLLKPVLNLQNVVRIWAPCVLAQPLKRSP